MSEIGWIKLHRELRYRFSSNKKMNFDLWNLYVYLAESAAWEDMRDLKRGQLKTTGAKIQDEWLSHIAIRRVYRLLDILQTEGYIKLARCSKIKQDGYMIEVCNYDSLFAKNDQKQCQTNDRRMSDECQTNDRRSEAESLPNKDAAEDECQTNDRRMTDECQTTGGLYIEERRKKEKKEEETELNTSREGVASRSEKQLALIDNDPPQKKPKKAKPPEGKSVAVINAYKLAYVAKYSVEPLINAKVRGQACQLVDRVGAEMAIALVGFYLGHNDAFYLRKAHPLGLCLSDAEKLHTEFQKQDYIFQQDAKKVEDATANSILLNQILERNKRRREDESNKS